MASMKDFKNMYDDKMRGTEETDHDERILTIEKAYKGTDIQCSGKDTEHIANLLIYGRSFILHLLLKIYDSPNRCSTFQIRNSPNGVSQNVQQVPSKPIELPASFILSTARG
ncbi:hypothetical protein JTB14_021817 [Gonioctena quinquepunctata]|nr:hypothetical protein JTB14_021817 [Gonioctena quinquepunctata]